MERACVYDSQARILSITHIGWYHVVLIQPTCRRGRGISHLRNAVVSKLVWAINWAINSQKLFYKLRLLQRFHTSHGVTLPLGCPRAPAGFGHGLKVVWGDEGHQQE